MANWAIAVWSLFGATAIWGFLFVLGMFAYRKRHYQHILLLMISLLLNAFTNLLRAFAVLFESSMLGIVSISFMIPGTVIILCFLDLIISDSIRHNTILILTFLSALIIRSFFDPNVITFSSLPDGTKHLLEDPNLAYPVLILLLVLVVRALVLSFQMLKKSPKSLKIYPKIFLVGEFLIAPAAMVLFTVGFTDIIYSGGVWVISALGNMIIFIAFIREPKLAFILPITITKLAIIDTNSGILVYSHNFDKREQFVDDVLFSGMLQGINVILNEAMKKGALVELKLAQALMIIERDPKYPVACILIATKTSGVLRKSLQSFFKQFITDFSPFFNNLGALDNFTKTDALIPLFFGFVPEYE